MNTFYEEHTGIFLNLIILFHLRGNSYDFIFPYKGKKSDADNRTFVGFDQSNLEIKKAVENLYIYKNSNTYKMKWYESIASDENHIKQRRFSKIIPSRKASAGNFLSIIPSSSLFRKKTQKVSQINN